MKLNRGFLVLLEYYNKHPASINGHASLCPSFQQFFQFFLAQHDVVIERSGGGAGAGQSTGIRQTQIKQILEYKYVL